MVKNSVAVSKNRNSRRGPPPRQSGFPTKFKISFGCFGCFRHDSQNTTVWGASGFFFFYSQQDRLARPKSRTIRSQNHDPKIPRKIKQNKHKTETKTKENIKLAGFGRLFCLTAELSPKSPCFTIFFPTLGLVLVAKRAQKKRFCAWCESRPSRAESRLARRKSVESGGSL